MPELCSFVHPCSGYIPHHAIAAGSRPLSVMSGKADVTMPTDLRVYEYAFVRFLAFILLNRAMFVFSLQHRHASLGSNCT